MNRYFPMAVFTAVALLAGAAQAATRQLCYELVFKDDRDDCPVTGDPGARRACQQTYYNWVNSPDGDYTNPVGAYLEVWDKDDTSDDEYIGTWVIGGTGRRCVTFEWENSNYDNGEANPDLYVIYKSKVRGTPGGPSVQAVDMAGASYGGVSWRNSAVSNCVNGVACAFAGYLLVTTDSGTERGGRVQALDSAQHMLQVFYSIMDASLIEMGWPADGSAAFDRGYFEVEGDAGAGGLGNENRALMAQSTAHELGHVLQMQMFEQDSLTNDCSFGGGGHALDVEEYDSCATTEGWAGYVAAVSLWDPANASSEPSRFSIDFVTNEPIDPVCTGNDGIEAQVVKAFWDLDDSTSEAAFAPATTADSNNSTTTFIAQGWDVFANGAGNRQDQEGGINGVNLWDYYENNDTRFVSATNLEDTLLYHNCLESQAP